MGKSSWPNRGHRLKHLIVRDEKPDVIPNPDPRSLQTLVMALSEEEFKRLTEWLSHMPNLTPNQFRNMLLEEESKQAAVIKGSNAASQDSSTRGNGEKVTGGGEGKRKYCNNCRKDGHSEDQCCLLRPLRCSACGKVGHGEDQCWRSHSELTPIWARMWPLKQNSVEAKGKSKGKKTNKDLASSEGTVG